MQKQSLRQREKVSREPPAVSHPGRRVVHAASCFGNATSGRLFPGRWHDAFAAHGSAHTFRDACSSVNVRCDENHARTLNRCRVFFAVALHAAPSFSQSHAQSGASDERNLRDQCRRHQGPCAHGKAARHHQSRQHRAGAGYARCAARHHGRSVARTCSPPRRSGGVHVLRRRREGLRRVQGRRARYHFSGDRAGARQRDRLQRALCADRRRLHGAQGFAD